MNNTNEFPCWLDLSDRESLCISSQEYYDYINEAANKLYQVMFGYMSQPDLDYLTSSHPQEKNCFVTALVMDHWCAEHEFNCEY